MILACIISFAVFISSANAQQTCNVGELYFPAPGTPPGLCNPNQKDPNKCDNYCRQKYGVELVSSECADRAKGKECVCKLKCATGGCWGDPHCYSFDGLNFGYHGLTQHALIKPRNKYPYLPQFEVRQINRLFPLFPGLAVLDKNELRIPEFDNFILVIQTPSDNKPSFTITVNNVVNTPIPYRYEKTERNCLHFVTVTNQDANTLVVETSFGLRIVIINLSYYSTSYNDVAIYIPRHPDLKGNSWGLLGRWNDDVSDDDIDFNGVKRPLDLFSWAFGNSWCYSNDGILSDADQQNVVKQHKKHKDATQKDSKKLNRLTQQCKKLKQNVKNCFKKHGRPELSVDDCITDISFAKDENQEKQICDAIAKKFSC